MAKSLEFGWDLDLQMLKLWMIVPDLEYFRPHEGQVHVSIDLGLATGSEALSPSPIGFPYHMFFPPLN